MNCRLLATIVLLLIMGTSAHAQEPGERVLPAESPAAADAAAPTTSETGSVAADPTEAQVIIIESSPEMERSEVVLKIVKALEKEGIAKVVPMNEANSRPVDFNARILVSPDLSYDSIRLEDVVRTLRLHGVQRLTFGSANPDADNAVYVNCLPDVAWREVRDLQEALSNFKAFQGDVRVAQNDGPVTSTLTPKFTGEPKPPESHEELAPSDNLPPNDDAAQIKTSVRLKYVEADNMARIISSLLNRTGKNPIGVVAHQQSNAILIFGEPTLVRQAEALVKRVDVPKNQWMGPEEGYQSPPPAQAVLPSSNATDVTGEFLKQAIADFRRRVEDLDLQSHDLADKLKQPLKPTAEVERLNVLLRGVVNKSFVTRQELRRAELELFAIRLRDLKQSVELRDRIADKIIDRRIEELLDPNLSWESSDDSTSSVDAPNGIPPGGVRAFLRVDKSSESVENVQWLLGQLARIGIAHISISHSGKPIVLDIIFPDDLPTEERTRLEREIKALEQDAPIEWIVRFMTASPPKLTPGNDLGRSRSSDSSAGPDFKNLGNGVGVPLDHASVAGEQAVSEDLKPAQRRLEICEACELSAKEAATLAKSEHSREILYLHDGGGQVIPLRRKPETLLNESDLLSAVAKSDPDIEGAYSIDLELNPEAAQRFAEETRRLSQQPSPVRLAILVSGKIHSAPRLVSEILNGKMRITGRFTKQEAEQLAADLIRKTDRPVLAPIPTRSNEN